MVVVTVHLQPVCRSNLASLRSHYVIFLQTNRPWTTGNHRPKVAPLLSLTLRQLVQTRLTPRMNNTNIRSLLHFKGSHILIKEQSKKPSDFFLVSRIQLDHIYVATNVTRVTCMATINTRGLAFPVGRIVHWLWLWLSDRKVTGSILSTIVMFWRLNNLLPSK